MNYLPKSTRAPLRKQIESALVQVLKKHYLPLLINSEASFQASFWSMLAQQFKRNVNVKQRRSFLQPVVSVGIKDHDVGQRFERKYPDYMVCDEVARKIIAVVELKYTPKKPPNWVKDLQTFMWLDTHRASVFVQNNRHHNSPGKKYGLADDAIFMWIGVYRHPEMKIEGLDDRLAPRFYSAHLAIDKDKEDKELEWTFSRPARRSSVAATRLS